ncbi:hypothetical protein V2W45_1206247, partial [Cenococcum geophilum]
AANIIVKRKSYKRLYIRNKEALIVSKVVNLIAVRKGSYYNNGKKPIKRVRAASHCGRYGEKEYNSRTYTVEMKEV